jgi:serine-type D-Ala-D-Ala carboxypeptidase/endopeptidase (penicillin-binding protein 4)
MNRTRTALALVLAAASVSSAQTPSLNSDVQRLVAESKLSACRVGISVRDVEGGVVLADFHAQEPLTPASNMKLITSGAALLILTPQHVFTTEVIADGSRLVVKGSGDPALADPDVLSRMSPRMTVGDVLETLAGAVARAGLPAVTEVVVDDRVFDRAYVHPAWPTDKLDRGYSAQVAGVNFHANVLLVYPRPGERGPGSSPEFAVEPEAPWLSIANKARTIATGTNSVWLSREPESNRFTLHGDVRYASQVGVEITLHNPPEFLGHLLAHHLRRSAGTPPGAGLPSVRLAGPNDPAPAGRTLAKVQTPIAEVLHRCNSDSANLYAEALLKAVGHSVTREPGSWDNGASVIRMALAQRLGPAMASKITISDGSGLSRANAVSPEAITKWLEALGRDANVRDVFAASLASPGEGTLKDRFKGERLRHRVYAKSGFINGVRTLSGYVVDEGSGRRVAFSVMVNDITTSQQTLAAKALHEQVVLLADRWLAARAPARGPREGG